MRERRRLRWNCGDCTTQTNEQDETLRRRRFRVGTSQRFDDGRIERVEKVAATVVTEPWCSDLVEHALQRGVRYPHDLLEDRCSQPPERCEAVQRLVAGCRRHERQRSDWYAFGRSQEDEGRRETRWAGFQELLGFREDLRSSFDRESQLANRDVRPDRLQLVGERGRDAEVPATTTDRPVEISVSIRPCTPERTIGRDDVSTDEVIDRQPVLPREPSDPTAERETSDTRVRNLTPSHCETMLLGRCIQVSPAETRAGHR